MFAVGAVFLSAAVGCGPANPGPAAPAPAPPPPGQAPPAAAGGPVLAVKIDNSPSARPPVGLGAADQVYVEPVEGGLSRIAAVFSSRKPPVVGPVRSARETDLGLLHQYGQPTLAFSGAAPELLPLIDRAQLKNASADLLKGAYFRDQARKAPHNLFARTDQLPRGSPWPAATQLRFGPAPAGGTPRPHEEVRYLSAAVGFDWSPEQHRWMVSMDGKPYAAQDTGPVSASTVVVQDVRIRDSAFKDTAGSASPLAETVGEGRATVLRDGKAFPVKWSRPSPEAAPAYTAPDGSPVVFDPGQVWTVFRTAGR